MAAIRAMEAEVAAAAARKLAATIAKTAPTVDPHGRRHSVSSGSDNACELWLMLTCAVRQSLAMGSNGN